MCSPVISRESVVDQRFFKKLDDHFTLAMGPLAGIAIENEIREMGEAPRTFPPCRTADLIRYLSRHIPRLDSKMRFLTAMTQEIKKRHMEGYC